MSPTDATATDARMRRPANRRELILEAAVELFHRHGYPATSVDDTCGDEPEDLDESVLALEEAAFEADLQGVTLEET